MLYPKSTAAWNTKGFALHSLSRYQEAIDCYDNLLQLDPKYKQAWTSKGFALHSLSRYQEAIKCYDKALQLDPKYKYTWNHKGFSLFCQKQFQAAAGCFEKALAEDKNFIFSLQGKALCLLTEDKKAEATALFAQVAQQEQTQPINGDVDSRAKLWFWRGKMLLVINETTEAKKAFEQALSLSPAFAPAAEALKHCDNLAVSVPQLKMREDVLIQKMADLQINQPAVAAQSVVVNKPVFAEKSWHFDGAAKAQGYQDNNKPYSLLPASPVDKQKVITHYQHHPVPGWDIKNIQVIYNPALNRGFSLRMQLLQQRANQPAFKAKWDGASQPGWRQAINAQYLALAKPYQDSDYPDIKLLPLWHGTKPEILDSLFSTGYANLAVTDEGFFGKGLYSAHEAEYSARVYSKGGILVLNWVCSFSAYPVIDGDMNKLAGKGNYGNYDAHFVPVVPASNSPNEVNYYPTKPNQPHRYIEMVVFESTQCLPRYLVELQPELPKAPVVNLGNNVHSLFGSPSISAKAEAIDLMQAAEYAYNCYLSKPYTLKTSSTGFDWSQTDWEYRHNSVIIHRPNHGLAHTMRTVFYAPYVLEYYLAHPQNKLSDEQKIFLQNQLHYIQLALIFFVAGRENEMGSHDDMTAYQRFRENSALAFEQYIKQENIPFSPQQMLTYKQAIKEAAPKKGALHALLRISHDIDTLRCLNKLTYQSVLKALEPYLGQQSCVNLSKLVLKCLSHTGDRVMGVTMTRRYNPKLFISASQNVEKCEEQINAAIQEWEADQAESKAAMALNY